MEQEPFIYTYSAAEQKEVRSIREKYLPQPEDKMEQLRRLDSSVTDKGSAVSVVLGTAGTVLLGIGMCCALVWGNPVFIPGIAMGIAGLAAIAASYPLYARITEKERLRIAPEILRLSDELMM